MIPKITVFVSSPSTSFEDEIVCKFIELGFAPLVDAKHGASHTWFKNNVQPTPHKLFTFTKEQIYYYSVDDLHEDMDFKPNVMIFYNDDDILSEDDWRAVYSFLRSEFNGIQSPRYDRGNYLMQRPVNEMKGLPQVEEEKPSDCYSFRMHRVDEKDTVLYEIVKPFTDCPYTSVIRQWSKRGHIAFFPSLFICTSWGVSRYDVPFLKYIWGQLEIEGNFDMDLLLKEATEKCYPSVNDIPEPEPEVYRRGIEDVLRTLQCQQDGIQCGHLSNAVPDEIKERFQ